MNKVTAKYDSAWKDVLDAYFPQAIELCFPELHAEINWVCGWESMDKEFQAISTMPTDAETADTNEAGRLYVDKLMRVTLKNGKTTSVLIHIEIEQRTSQALAARMFFYALPILIKYKKPLVSCVILNDSDKNFRPTHYDDMAVGGRGVQQDFWLCKLIDFEERREELESSMNPFATVILFQLDALLAKKQSGQQRMKIKMSLTRGLFNKGFKREEVYNLFRFLNYVIALPAELSVKYVAETHELTKEETMPYLSDFELWAMEKGHAEGEKKARNQIALNFLKAGTPLELVMQATGLTTSELEKLQEMH